MWEQILAALDRVNCLKTGAECLRMGQYPVRLEVLVRKRTVLPQRTSGLAVLPTGQPEDLTASFTRLLHFYPRSLIANPH